MLNLDVDLNIQKNVFESKQIYSHFQVKLEESMFKANVLNKYTERTFISLWMAVQNMEGFSGLNKNKQLKQRLYHCPPQPIQTQFES